MSDEEVFNQRGIYQLIFSSKGDCECSIVYSDANTTLPCKLSNTKAPQASFIRELLSVRDISCGVTLADENCYELSLFKSIFVYAVVSLHPVMPRQLSITVDVIKREILSFSFQSSFTKSSCLCTLGIFISNLLMKFSRIIKLSE